MRKIRVLIAAVLFVTVCSGAFADEAIVTFVSGKVEVQRNGKWIALQKGDTVEKSETISTGFQSEAKIKVLNSVMYLGPVTRITLEELSSSGSQDNVNVYLKTGTARSQVKHVDNKHVNYQVHTAVAVASCRGTEWIIDDSNNVDCFEGVVAVSAYKPVQLVENADNEFPGAEEEVEGKEEKTETSAATGEEKTASSGESEKTTDSSKSEETSKTVVAERPTSNDGVLVQANQTVKVSANNSVSAPVKTVVKNANTIKSAVSSAAAKAAVGGEKTAVEAPQKDNSIMEAVKKVEEKKQIENEKGTVVVKITIPSEK